MSDIVREVLTPDELDAIGEIMNISMGAAATAVSTMLEKQVTITTPRMEQNKFKNIDSSNVEPALIVKIKYVEGIEGTNTTMLKKHDMQVILDILMGNDTPSSEEDFEFDDMSMSAACEVMNQMMGASATALSEILDMPINISTPEAILVESKDEVENTFTDIRGDEPVVAISFSMMIKDVLDTAFISFLPVSLAAKIIDRVNKNVEDVVVEEEPVAVEQVKQAPLENQFVDIKDTQQEEVYQAPQFVAEPLYQQPQEQFTQEMAQPQMQASQPQMQQQQMQQPQMQPPQMQQQQMQQPQAQQMQYAMPPQGYQQQFDGMQMQGYQQPYMPQQQGVGFYNPNAQQQGGYAPPPVAVKKAEFPDFAQHAMRPTTPSGSNMGLLMGVQLEISVIVGRTKRKIKDIMDFGQGAVIELDKQTGAPAEIVVNGQLLAYGDVIVVGDNFGVRITEIVGSKELMDLLSNS